MAGYFAVKTGEAQTIAGEVATVVAKWRDEAKRVGVPDSEINRMASAFEHEDLQKAAKFAKTKAMS